MSRQESTLGLAQLNSQTKAIAAKINNYLKVINMSGGDHITNSQYFR